jgi:ABC-type Fe3+ transport system substrate-binding protein
MATAAPSIENLVLLQQIREIIEDNKKLHAEIDLLKSELNMIRKAGQADGADIKDLYEAVDRIENRKPSDKAKHEARMRQVDRILMQHGNGFITFSDLGKLLGYPSKTRYQNMTHLKNVFLLFPDRYEVQPSKLGGKKVRLVNEYLNHLLKGGD